MEANRGTSSGDPARAVLAVVGVGAVSIAVFLAAPVGSGVQAGAWMCPLVLATGMLAFRLRCPIARRPVILLLTGLVTYLSSTIAWELWPVATGVAAPFPSVLDGIFLASYACFTAFVMAVWRRRRGPRHVGDRVELVDALVLSLAMLAVVWVVAIHPNLHSGAALTTTLVAIAYPAMLVLLFAVSARLALAGGVTRSWPDWALLAWLAGELIGSLLYVAGSARGTFDDSSVAFVFWMLGYVGLATVASRGGLDALLRPAEDAPHRSVGLKARRHIPLAVLLAICGVPLTLGVVAEGHATLPVVAAAMVALVLYRTSLLAGDMSSLAVGLDDAVKQLRLQHAQLLGYQAIVHSSEDAIFSLSPLRVITDWNPGAERLFGYSAAEAVGQSVAMLAVGADDETVDAERIRKLIQSGHMSFEAANRRKDGSTVTVSVTVSAIRGNAGPPTSYVAIVRDMTAQRAREAQSQQASKLESLGRMSAGLAHEINSPIQFVGDNARFLSSAYDDLGRLIEAYRCLLQTEEISWQDRVARMHEVEAAAEFDYLREEIPSAIRQTLEGVDRVATIVRAMKTFSHPGSSGQAPADLNEALAATVTVSRHQVHAVADVQLELATGLPLVQCSVAELNQVFLNLMVNAADAIEETGRRGTITVASAMDGDDHVVVRITDTGGGIPGEVLGRLFDPFFTTKEVGRGTGQGLPMARGVVHEGHDGELTVDTVLGVGSTFTVRLPVAGRAANPPAPVLVTA